MKDDPGFLLRLTTLLALCLVAVALAMPGN